MTTYRFGFGFDERLFNPPGESVLPPELDPNDPDAHTCTRPERIAYTEQPSTRDRHLLFNPKRDTPNTDPLEDW